MCVSCWAGVTYLHCTVLTSSKEEETAVHCCDPALLILVTLVSRNVFHIVSALQSIDCFRTPTWLPPVTSCENTPYCLLQATRSYEKYANNKKLLTVPLVLIGANQTNRSLSWERDFMNGWNNFQAVFVHINKIHVTNQLTKIPTFVEHNQMPKL